MARQTMPSTPNPRTHHHRFRNWFPHKTLAPGFRELLKNLNNPGRVPRTTTTTTTTTTLTPDLKTKSSSHQQGSSEGHNAHNSNGNMAQKTDSQDPNQSWGVGDGEEKLQLGGNNGADGEPGGGGGGGGGGEDDEDSGSTDHGHRHGQGGSGHEHGGETVAENHRGQCPPVDWKYRKLIEDKLELLQKRCQEFSACTEELYSASNYHLILEGENTRLKNICGLMYANGGGQYTTLKKECSAHERQAIRQSIGGKLKEKLGSESLDDTWKSLHDCVLEHREDNEDHIDTVCRLRGSKTSGILCNNTQVNVKTRDFFNHELEHLHCSCVALNAADDTGRRPLVPGPVRFAIAGGVICLLIVLIVIIVILCLRHRKTKRKLKEHRMRQGTMPSASREEHSAIYNEIQDIPSGRPKLPDRQAHTGKLLPQGYELDVSPALPERYVKGLNLPRSTRCSPSDDDDRPHSYLEPLPDPVPGTSGQAGPRVRGTPASKSAAGQGKGSNSYSLAKQVGDPHPSYSLAQNVNMAACASGDYQLARHPNEGQPSGSEGTYFDTIKVARARAEDEFGYSQLRRPERSSSRVTATKAAAADRESSASQTAQYFELEAEPGGPGHRDSTGSGFQASTKL